MGRPAGWMKALTGRSAMKSPGAPSLRRDVERLFWREIARGLNSEDAAVAVGVSQAAGSRWFRERGGMPSFMVAPLSGRYLTFEEREEIAMLNAQDVRASRSGPPQPATGPALPRLSIAADRVARWRDAAQRLDRDLEDWIVVTLDHGAQQALS